MLQSSRWGTVELHLGAFDRLPEAYVDGVLQIAARLGLVHHLAASTASAEDVGENVAESAAGAGSAAGCARAFGEVVEIESAEVEGNFLRGARSATGTGALARSAESTCTETAAAAVGFGCGGIDVVGVEAELVVNLALLGIAENVVRLGEGLELLFRAFVPGIDVGMILARELAERLADVVGRGSFLYAKDGVIVFVFVGRSGHDFWLLAVSSPHIIIIGTQVLRLQSQNISLQQ